jgi:hypothetical protein
MPVLTVAGDLSSPLYQEARAFAEDLRYFSTRFFACECLFQLIVCTSLRPQTFRSNTNPELQLVAKAYVESAWTAYLKEQKLVFGGTAFEHSPIVPFVSHSVLGYIGGLDELISWARSEFPKTIDHRYAIFSRDLSLRAICNPLFIEPVASTVVVYRGEMKEYLEIRARLDKVAQSALAKEVKDSSHKYVFLDFSIDPGSTSSLSGDSSVASKPHRVVIELFTDKCPKTCDNFYKVRAFPKCGDSRFCCRTCSNGVVDSLLRVHVRNVS